MRPEAGLPVLWLGPGLEMSAGKAMAQAAHGAQLAWWDLPDCGTYALARVRIPAGRAHRAGT